jgi:hypothetical protein
MSSSHALYNRVFERLRAAHPKVHLKRVSNWVWIVVGMILSHSVQLSQIAQHVPSEAEAAGRIAQIRRWLSNRFVNVPVFYRPLIQQVLANWASRAVFIILDATSVNHGKLQVLRLSLAHGLRALPLAWRVLSGPGLVGVECATTLFSEAARVLKPVDSMTFLADRGFRGTAWAEKCLKMGWNYIIRIANNTYLTFPDGQQVAIAALRIKPGRSRYFQNVRLTQDADWLCNVMVTWTRATPKQPAELCAVISNLRACHHTLKAYLTRMHIEQSFRDDKSGTFELASTHLTDPQRLNHLLLALAVAILWIHEIGQRVLEGDDRKDIDPAARRQLSIVQIGWRKLRRAISSGHIPLLQFLIRPMRLAPVTAAPAKNGKNQKC